MNRCATFNGQEYENMKSDGQRKRERMNTNEWLDRWMEICMNESFLLCISFSQSRRQTIKVTPSMRSWQEKIITQTVWLRKFL
jgi:hypothetical protein